jgi:outer membrane protein OmpA-like peptidoglycan-associated protein
VARFLILVCLLILVFSQVAFAASPQKIEGTFQVQSHTPQNTNSTSLFQTQTSAAQVSSRPTTKAGFVSRFTVRTKGLSRPHKIKCLKVRTKDLNVVPETPGTEPPNSGAQDTETSATEPPPSSQVEETEVTQSSDNPPAATASILFALGRAKILPESLPLLEQAGAAINDPQVTGKNFLVAGHTCDIGSDSSNQALSEKRALAVMNYLIERCNVDPGRLYGKGYGESSPEYPNTSEETRSLNRRVVFAVLN